MIGLQRLAIPSYPPAKCPPVKRPPFSLDLPAVIVVNDILPNWGLFGIIKQICHANVGILMECLPEGGWFSSFILPLGDIPSGYPHWHGIFVYCHTILYLGFLKTVRNIFGNPSGPLNVSYHTNFIAEIDSKSPFCWTPIHIFSDWTLVAAVTVYRVYKYVIMDLNSFSIHRLCTSL